MREPNRRSLLRVAATAPTLAIPVIAVGAPEGDPVFALIAEWRAEAKRISEANADEDGKHDHALTQRLDRAIPTTLPGLLALSEVFREEAQYSDNAELWLDTICTALAKLNGGTPDA